MDDLGIESRQVEIFIFSKSTRRATEPTHPPVQWVRGGGGNFPGVKRPGREADPSRSSSEAIP